MSRINLMIGALVSSVLMGNAAFAFQEYHNKALEVCTYGVASDPKNLPLDKDIFDLNINYVGLCLPYKKEESGVAYSCGVGYEFKKDALQGKGFGKIGQFKCVKNDSEGTIAITEEKFPVPFEVPLKDTTVAKFKTNLQSKIRS